MNHSPSIAIDFKTLIKVWSNKPTEYSMLKVFRCLTYYHISEGKLEPRAKKGFFMVYGDGVKGFQVWSPSKRKVILSIYVIFHKLSILHSKSMKIWARLSMSLSRWSLRTPQLKTLVIKSRLKYLMRLIKIFKCTLNIRIQHQLKGLIG